MCCCHIVAIKAVFVICVNNRYCTVFPTINVNGTLKHLQLLPHELLQYEEQLDTVLKRYLLRLQWLLAGTALPPPPAVATRMYSLASSVSTRLQLCVRVGDIM